MSEFNITAALGPRYEIVINQDQVEIDSNFDLTLTPQEPLRLTVGTGFNINPVDTGTLDVAIIAQSTINAYRAVGYDGLFTQPTADSLSRYAGVNRIAAVSGDPLNVVRVGLMEENGWSWIPNTPIFIGTDGVLTQIQPVFGNPVRRIGWAISATTLNLDPYPIIGV